MEQNQESIRNNRVICVPFDADQYDAVVKDPVAFRAYLDEKITLFPEIFPDDIATGYQLKELRHSIKLSMFTRRIIVSGISYTVRPSFVMPYMAGKTFDTEHALFLRKFNVPFWALAHVFGKDAMYWYRLEQSLGRNSIVGTTVRCSEDIPKDLGADEKHTWHSGEKAYVATTVGNGCILGAAISTDSGEKALTEAYGVFKDEARCVDPDYSPHTVNTDGWGPTRNAWQAIFPLITVLCCFLHVFIKIRDRSKKKFREIFLQATDKLWHCYKATTKGAFCQRIRRLHEWAKKNKLPDVILNPIAKLRKNLALFSAAYDFPGALRTSNMVDRLMRKLDQHLFSTQYFHGFLPSAQLGIRGWVLINNFAPSNPATVQKYGGLQSPAQRLNNHSYHDSWLQNLLVSASLGGFRGQPPNPL